MSPESHGRARRLPSRRTILLVVLVALAVLALRIAWWGPADVRPSTLDDGLVRVSGAIHVHTAISDGGGSPERVIAAARASGLGFIVLTDHNRLDGKPFQGYRDGVLAIVGAELSTTAGHLLAIGIPDPGFPLAREVREALDDVHVLGGVPFASHPWTPRKGLRWTGWDLPGSWGIEVMNIDSAWRRAGWARLAWATLLHGLNRHYGVLFALDTPSMRLSDWDALLAERDVAGIGGADAHGRVFLTDSLVLPLPAYESVLSVAKNHVLLDSPLSGDPVADTARIVDALRRGALYVAVDALAPGEGFVFVLAAEGRRFTMGETAPVDLSGRLQVGGRLPARTRLTLLRDGQLLAEGEAHLDVPVPGPGVYRVEARLPGWTVPWVLSNPIYVFDDATRQVRAARGRWPSEPVPPPAVRMIDTFEAATIFTAGCDPTSWIRADILDPSGGIGGGGAGRMEFRLGVSGSDGRGASCELANREARDLTGYTGLVFSVRSDAPYRLWVQVRDRNRALTEHTESWVASVRTSTEWRRIAIPFSSFRTVVRETDGTLDLDEVRALVFLLDRDVVKAGTSGTIWVDDLGLY